MAAVHAPLLADRPHAAQVVGAIVVPAAYGALVGVVLGWSATWYWALSVVGLLGGIAAGLEHRGGIDGAERGFLAGLLFGSFVLLAHAVHGEPAEASIGQLPGLLPLVAGIATALAGAIGGAIRGGGPR